MTDVPTPPESTPRDAVRLGDVVVVLAVAVLVLALVDSQGFLNWARDLPAGRFPDFVRLLVYAWHVMMERIGLTDVFQGLRELLQALRGV